MSKRYSDNAILHRRFTRPLMCWYSREGRTLPWRQTPDPYAVWISEIMLQQTQVRTVVPYFERFLKTYPDVRSLAAASMEDVLKVWEGLGYYGRARNLKKAAEMVDRFHQGLLPDDAETIRRLPGIGRSTAGAILSIGYGQRQPILDGNVRRVLSRYFAVRESGRGKSAEERLWKLSEVLTDPKDPGSFSQAIMDLGATVCTSRDPNCPHCPVRLHCRAYRQGRQSSYPMKVAKNPIPHQDHLAILIVRRDRFLMHQRPARGLLGGLWEFPGGPLRAGEEKKDGMERILREQMVLSLRTAEAVGLVKHTFSHFKMTLHVYKVSARGKRATLPKDYRWWDIDTPTRMPMSSVQQKVLNLFRTAGALPGVGPSASR